jgi:hypothetical protein
VLSRIGDAVHVHALICCTSTEDVLTGWFARSCPVPPLQSSTTGVGGWNQKLPPVTVLLNELRPNPERVTNWPVCIQRSVCHFVDLPSLLVELPPGQFYSLTRCRTALGQPQTVALIWGARNRDGEALAWRGRLRTGVRRSGVSRPDDWHSLFSLALLLYRPRDEDHIASHSAHRKWRAGDRRQHSRAWVKSESCYFLGHDADVYEFTRWVHGD